MKETRGEKENKIIGNKIEVYCDNKVIWESGDNCDNELHRQMKETSMNQLLITAYMWTRT
jgi:hypothetical protein